MDHTAKGIQFPRKQTIREGWDAFEFSFWACKIDSSKAEELMVIFGELVELAGGESVGSVRVADDAEKAL
jgi:hypothetical protein